MQILDLHPLLYRHQLFSIIRYYEIALISYTNGLSLISFGLRGYCFGAVSYTHLDVYKRQVCQIQRPSAFACFLR